MRVFIVIFLTYFLFLNTLFSQSNEEYIVSSIDINDSGDNSGVSFYKQNYIIHTAPKKDKNIHDKDFYISLADENGKVYKGELLTGNLNSFINEIDFVFTNDKKKVYFTRSYKDDSGKKEHFDIYVADVTIDNQFKNIKSLPINYKNFSTANPSLSQDNKTLYFSSNRKESLGGFDIFKVYILENGKRFSRITNLGPSVNTKGDEITPFIVENKLYFSSNGMHGLGGYDVYSANLELNEKAVNLGKTINTAKDDFGYIRKQHRNYGYVCSNRNGGKGNNDIYYFKVIKVDSPVVMEVDKNIKNEEDQDETNNEGLITINNEDNNETSIKNNKLTVVKEKPIKNNIENDELNVVKEKLVVRPEEKINAENFSNSNKIKVHEIDKSTIEVKDKDGRIVNVKRNYRIINNEPIIDETEVNIQPEYEEEIIYKEKTSLAENIYDFQRREVYTTTKEEVGRIKKLRKALSKKERHCIDRIEKLDDIYFDLDKFNIRPDAQIQVNKAIKIMEKCPNLKFVASSFTDSRGSSEYNRKLSQRRADSVVLYILNNSSLPASRIIGVGYGESGLKNQCYNGVKCSEKEHQINRRTEIEVSIN